jgi:SAM-dependent methyltransferase
MLDKEVMSIIDRTIELYVKSPIDLLDTNDNEGAYVGWSRISYVRTVKDIVHHYQQAGITDFSKIKVLEIGAFLGIVSIILAKIGFSVVATDLPIFMKNSRLRQRYKEHGVAWAELDLKDGKIEFAEGAFDLVIMCETLEHLNFNPVPSLFEIRRILRPNGILYLAHPNLAHWGNRKKLLLGQSIHNPIDHFFQQLDPTKNMIVAIHWREYTAQEIRELLGKIGLSIKRQYYFSSLGATAQRLSLVGLLFRFVIYPLVPFLREDIVTIAIKQTT